MILLWSTGNAMSSGWLQTLWRGIISTTGGSLNGYQKVMLDLLTRLNSPSPRKKVSFLQSSPFCVFGPCMFAALLNIASLASLSSKNGALLVGHDTSGSVNVTLKQKSSTSQSASAPHETGLKAILWEDVCEQPFSDLFEVSATSKWNQYFCGVFNVSETALFDSNKHLMPIGVTSVSLIVRLEPVLS